MVDKVSESIPSKKKASRAWFDGFHRCHANLTIRSPQLLFYCRALCAVMVTIESMYGRLNLSDIMQVYNCEKTGLSIVHKPNTVIEKLGHRNVYALTCAERENTHTILSIQLGFATYHGVSKLY